jgi:hypothetical protein
MQFLYSVSVTTAANGNFSATIPVAAPPGEFVTATATDAGNDTSQFSNDEEEVVTS